MPHQPPDPPAPDLTGGPITSQVPPYPPGEHPACQVPDEYGRPVCVKDIDQRPCATCPRWADAASPPAEALDIRPGDTLIVRYSTHLTAEQLAPVDQGLSEALPDVRVIVLRADGMARYRPDQTATKE